MNLANAVIVANGVSKSYGLRRALLRVNLQVGESEIVALLGPNGGGKTTLFRILATLLRPDHGQVTICGFDLVDRPAEVRRQIGVVFQNPSLDKKLTAAENLRHHGHLYGLRGPELRARAEEILAALKLADRAADLVETLSGGLARRVEIAKCLLTKPRILLLDEPSTGLDPIARRDLWELLDDIRRQQQVTVLLTTHLMEEAEKCDRVVILDAGKVVGSGTPAELTARVGGDVITIDTADPALVARLLAEQFDLVAAEFDGCVRVEAPEAAALVPRLVSALPPDVRAITVGRPTLEDAFIDLTGHAFDQEAAS